MINQRIIDHFKNRDRKRPDIKIGCNVISKHHPDRGPGKVIDISDYYWIKIRWSKFIMYDMFEHRNDVWVCYD